jgi:hypothetical protein
MLGGIAQMANNRPHTLKDQFYYDQRGLRDDEATAKVTLEELWRKLGDEAYDRWVDLTITNTDNWQDIQRKAKDMLLTLNIDAEQSDYRATMADVVNWARGT